MKNIYWKIMCEKKEENNSNKNKLRIALSCTTLATLVVPSFCCRLPPCQLFHLPFLSLRWLMTCDLIVAHHCLSQSTMCSSASPSHHHHSKHACSFSAAGCLTLQIHTWEAHCTKKHCYTMNRCWEHVSP